MLRHRLFITFTRGEGEGSLGVAEGNIIAGVQLFFFGGGGQGGFLQEHDKGVNFSDMMTWNPTTFFEDSYINGPNVTPAH